MLTDHDDEAADNSTADRELVDDEHSSSQETYNSSPQGFFHHVDKQHSNLVSQLQNCELQRMEIVREMAEHVLSFGSHPSVFQRHAELASRLPGLQQEHERLSKKLASVQVLADKRKDIESLMTHRLNGIDGTSNFSINELRQLIESEASANMLVEILKTERSAWKLQRKQAMEEIIQLKLQSSEKDERIRILEEKVEYLYLLQKHQQQLASESMSVSSQNAPSSASESSSLLHSSPDTRSRSPSITTRRRNGNLQISSSPMSDNNYYAKSNSSATATTTTSADMFTSQHAKNPVIMIADQDAIRKEQEKSLRSRVQQEAAKEEARGIRQIQLERQELMAQGSSNDHQLQKRMGPVSMKDTTGFENHLKSPVMMIADQDDSRKEQEKSFRRRMQQEAAKQEDSRRTRQAATSDQLMMSPSLSNRSGFGRSGRPFVSPSPTMSSFGSAHPSQRQAAQMMAPLSHSSSSRSAFSFKESSSMHIDMPPLASSASAASAASLPGAVRMSADGEIMDRSDRVQHTDDDAANGTLTPITATLVREQSLGKIHAMEQEAASAEVAAVSVPAVATAVARVSGRSRMSSLSDASVSVSSRTMGAIQENDSAPPDLEAGPLRFHAGTERSLQVQLREFTEMDYECFRTLQNRWEKTRKEKGSPPYSASMILRFLRNTSRKDGAFSLKKAWKAMRKCKERNLFLSAAKLQKQLLTATLFPIPGLLSHAGFEMFYMKPCRYHRKDSVRDVIDNLVYVMNCMLEKEGNSKNGIGFLACMNDWKMSNFDTTYCYRFMMALQAAVVPVTVELFLIVNPPSWFGKIWKVMRPMLAPSFRKKVKVINESMLDVYLMEGYRQYLPDDLSTGTVNTFQLAQDFVTYRKYIERGNLQLHAKSATIDEDSVSQLSGTSFTNWRGAHHQDSSDRTFSDMDNLGGSAYDDYSSNDLENDDDDASIHCSINGEEEISVITEA